MRLTKAVRSRGASVPKLNVRHRRASVAAVYQAVCEGLEVRWLLSAVGNWVALSTTGTAPPDGGSMLNLLSNGKVLIQDGLNINPNNGSTSEYLLSPQGPTYADGSWSQTGSLNEVRLFSSSAVLPDGRVFVVGGEYPNFSNTCEIYNPGNGVWTYQDPFPQSQFGDDPIEVLSPDAAHPDGQVLCGYVSGSSTYLFNPDAPAGSQWSQTGNSKRHNDRSDEETWVKLSDGSILSYDVYSSASQNVFQAQRYVPSTNTWVDASTLNSANPPSILTNGSAGSELGPGFLLPSGKVIIFGALGNTAIYDPAANNGNGSWSAGPNEPVASGGTQLVASDDPGAELPNGNVLISFSPQGQIGGNGNYTFPGPTYIYEYNPNAAGTGSDPYFTDVSPGNGNVGGSSIGGNAFKSNMLVLPTGQVLLATEDGPFQIYSENASTGPQNAWRPTITSIHSDGGVNYTLTGTLLGGISEGAKYGDDLSSATDYPIIEIADYTKSQLTYATSSSWSSTAVATGSTTETTNFSIPASYQGDSLGVVAIANGIPSAIFSSANFNFTVTNTNDSGAGSLRQVIIDANTYDASNITFNIPTSDPNYANGVFTISPLSQLPAITDSNLTIDGRSETTNTGLQNPSPYPGPVIFLNGGNQNIAGLVVSASGDVIANMGIEKFAGTGSGAGGIVIAGSATGSDFIKGCLIGIAPNGTSAAGNGIGISTAQDQVGGETIYSGSSGTDPNVIGFNTIGIALTGGSNDTVNDDFVGATTYDFSVPNGTGIQITTPGNSVTNSTVSDNTGSGISISGNTNTITGNYIGMWNGSPFEVAIPTLAPNGADGVYIHGGAQGNMINGGNVIAGNSANGVEIDAATSNIIQANYIGNDVNQAYPNASSGIYMHDGASNNSIGATTYVTSPGSTANVISGNSGAGVYIQDSTSTGNLVYGDYIGTDSSSDAIGNAHEGVLISANGQTVQGCVISDNGYAGVNLSGASNIVQYDLIGTRVSGNSALGNSHEGVYISGNNDGVYYSTISGNAYTGVSIVGASNDTVYSDYIGTNSSGGAAIPNHQQGVLVTGTNAIIDGDVISGNTLQGISLGGSGGGIYGDYIGTNAGGTAAIANGTGGIYVNGTGDTIGGPSVYGNVISGNSSGTGYGIEFDTAGAYNDSVLGNYIGTNSAGSTGLGNVNGIIVQSSAYSITIGGTTSGYGNIIGGNQNDGVIITGSSHANILTDNIIGVIHEGAVNSVTAGYYAIANGADGILISNGSAYNTITGGVIAGNTNNGINIDDSSFNTIQGATIGFATHKNNSLATVKAPNGSSGIYIHDDAQLNSVGSAGFVSTPGSTANIIAENGGAGIYMQDSDSTSNTVYGDYIGTDSNSDAIGNTHEGVLISASDDSVEGCVISGNGYAGVSLSGSGNNVEYDLIGTNAAGTAALGNSQQGINITNGSGDRISNNTISGNSGDGIYVTSSASGLTITTNQIGTNAAGTAAVANATAGVEINAANITVGGTTANARNIISGNSTAGIEVDNVSGTTIEDNYIGTNAAGTAAVSTGTGISVGGPTTSIIGNLISGDGDAVFMFSPANGTKLYGNLIGTDYTGLNPIGNTNDGIDDGSGGGTTIGGFSSGQGNTIDNSGSAGINLSSASDNATVTDCTLFNNYGGISNGGTLNIYNSTITGNQGGFGGGISNSDNLNVYDSTITKNSATFGGGGIYESQVQNTSTLLDNDIIAQNTGGDVSGAVSSSSAFNLIGNGSGLSGISNGVNQNQIGTGASPIDPLLGSLANNGGNTETLLPASNSRAINGGIGLSSISTDQRGAARPTSGAVDIGAVQLQNSLVTLTQTNVYLRLATDGQTLDIYYNNTGTGTPAQTYLLSTVGAMDVAGTGNGQTLTVDFTNGDPIPLQGVTYNPPYPGYNNYLNLIGSPYNNTVTVQSTSVTVAYSTGSTYYSSTISVPYYLLGSLTYSGDGGSDTVIQDFGVGNNGTGLQFVNPTSSDTLEVLEGSYLFPENYNDTGVTDITLGTLDIGFASAVTVPPSYYGQPNQTLLELGTLSIAGSTGNWLGNLELDGNDLDVQNGSLATITNMLAAGFAANWEGESEGGFGHGIDDYAAALDRTYATALGVVQQNGPGTFDGQSVTGGTVLVKHTWYGDADLSGAVDGNDYSIIDADFGATNATWGQGDFNYDGVVDGSDYSLIDNAFNQQTAAPLAEVATPLSLRSRGPGSAVKDRLSSDQSLSVDSLWCDTPVAELPNLIDSEFTDSQNDLLGLRSHFVKL
jgi:parallel beta-helix repeat protein